MIKTIINYLNPNTMARRKMKICTISGRKFTADTKNFYVNHNTTDGLHPYHKSFDNFRRTTGATVKQVRQLVNLING
tara:strand:- start:307 stop:537 length:231 start_codon:yes stop_codon:yes gene_type:complete